MKRLTALLCCLLMLFAAASAESDDSRSFLLHFTDTLPSALSGALSGSGYEDAVIADGYATMRFGRWSHIEMLLSQDGQYILAAGFYSSAESAWHITCSANALRQNGDMPSLLPAAVKYGQTSDYDISQYDGCDAFDITYADGTVYSWFCGSSGFFLSCVSNGRMVPPLQKVTAKEATLFKACMDDISSQIIASYPKSTVVEVLGVSGSYAHVRLQDGQSGYIALKEIGGTPKMALPNEIKLTKAASRCQYDASTGEYVDDGTFSKGTTLVFNVRETAHWESVDGELVWTEVQYVYAYNKKNPDEYGYVSADLEWVP